MSRRRSFTRRRGRRVRGLTINHFEDDTTFAAVATATETTLTVATGVDDASNRSTHVPDGAWLKSIKVNLQAGEISSTQMKLQGILWRRPGGDATTNPITNYYATTDPATQSMMNVRRFKLRGPFTVAKAANDITPPKMSFRWRGNLKMRDGDDILLTILHNAGANRSFTTQVFTSFRNG